MKDIIGFQGEYRWLSNFWHAPFMYSGVRYETVEHAYQAAKTTDPAERKAIINTAGPGGAKTRGRLIKHMRPDWDQVKLQIMEDLVYAKFSQNPELASKLRTTGSAQLVEDNWWHDTFWGVCNGKGENHLGKILMRVRGAV